MPDYIVTLTFDDIDGIMTPRAAAESVYNHLMISLLYGQCEMELKDKKTGEVQVIELEEELENDETVLRHMALTMLAARFMTEEQKEELTAWEAKNLDGHSVSTLDWPGWEAIIGQKQPKRFRKTLEKV